MLNELAYDNTDIHNISSASLRPRVLIAEDCPETRTFLFSLFENVLNCETTFARDGLGLLELALISWQTGKSFDMLLVDVYLPNLNGMDVVEHLRHKGYDGFIVGISGRSTGELRKLCFSKGCDGYVSKGVSLDDLTETLSYFLDRSGALFDQALHGQTSTHDIDNPASFDDVNYDLSIAKQLFMSRLLLDIDGLHDACRKEEWEIARTYLHRLKSSALYGFNAHRELEKIEHVISSSSVLDALREIKTLHSLATTWLESSRGGDSIGHGVLHSDESDS